MTVLHSDVLQFSSRFADRVEGRCRSTTFDIQIHSTNWLEPGEGLFKSPRSFIQMFSNTSRLVTGAHEPDGRRAEYVDLGHITFIAKDEPLRCRWQRGTQRSVSCMFDIEKITARMAIAWDWPSFDWANALAIRSDYIAATLRRVATETLNPGFASELQIETLLLGAAFELRRQFGEEEPVVAKPARELGRAQLDILRAMAIDTPGDPPSIADLADAVGMGGRQLAARYRAATGQTLRNFLAESRLERAKLLLRDRRLLVKQVAFDCGFRSSAAFAAAFSGSTGMTPQSFRTRVLSQ